MWQPAECAVEATVMWQCSSILPQVIILLGALEVENKIAFTEQLFNDGAISGKAEAGEHQVVTDLRTKI